MIICILLYCLIKIGVLFHLLCVLILCQRTGWLLSLIYVKFELFSNSSSAKHYWIADRTGTQQWTDSGIRGKGVGWGRPLIFNAQSTTKVIQGQNINKQMTVMSHSYHCTLEQVWRQQKRKVRYTGNLRAEFLALEEVCKAILWPILGFRRLQSGNLW